MTHPSYAQAGEDTSLWELVGDKADGFYIDVGAYHYNIFSVSRSFYEAGWTGVNVEPMPWHAELLAKMQPNSQTFDGALGAKKGKATLYTDDMFLEGLSTLSPERAEHVGLPLQIMVQVITLAELCQRYVKKKHVDWLKIDVEGTEEDILRSGDWDRYRPDFLCIEAVTLELVPAHENWEPFVLDSGYEYLRSDSYNRYYRSLECRP